MIKFKKLGLKNFRSYKDLEIDNFNEMGLTLISGTNGSGKSTIRTAIEYLLLDTTSDPIPLDELCRDSKEPCELYCDLETEHGDKVEIRKYRNHKKLGNKIEFLVNDDDKLTTSDRRITQKNIEDFLGITTNLLFSSNIYSQNSASFVECKEKDRKEILYNFIDKDLYEQLLKGSEKDYKEIQSKIENLNSDLGKKQIQLDSTKEHLNSLDSAETGYREETRKEIIDLLRDRDAVKEKSAKEYKKQIEELKKKISNDFSLDKLTRLQNKLDLIMEDYKKNEKELTLCNSKLKSIGNSVCPILKSNCTFLVDAKEKLEKEFNPIKENINSRLDVLAKKGKDVQEKIDELENIAEHNVEINSNIRSLEREIEIIDEYNKDLSNKIKKLDDKIKEKGEKLKTNKFLLMKEESEKNIEKLNKDIEQLQSDIKTMQEELKYPEYWTKGFSRVGIPSMKMDGILASIEEETNNYLSKIGDNMFVSIDAQTELKSSSNVREKISYNVNHPDKEIKNYYSYSSGERQRVKLSDIFAFNSLFGKLDILILDEVLELSLDDKGVSSVISLLREKGKELGSLFVISHNDDIKNSFDNSLKAVKKNGISQLQGVFIMKPSQKSEAMENSY